MENRINQVFQTESGKYLVLNQAIYHGKTYFLAAGVNDNLTDINGILAVLQVEEENGKETVSVVKDQKLLTLLLKYLQKEVNV